LLEAVLRTALRVERLKGQFGKQTSFAPFAAAVSRAITPRSTFAFLSALARC
jgi:hypothetical protein